MSATAGLETSGLDLTAEELALIAAALESNKLFQYKPYDWQIEIHDAGKDNPERMLMAANRVGKTFSGGAETAYHATGKYPDWWKGKVFTSPVLIWTGSPTNETSKDIVQKELLGGLGEELGTGAIPKDAIVGKPSIRQAGVRDVVDSFKVRHTSGGLSTVVMKTYEQGWKKWQGTAPHFVWMDEEPDDYMIFSEAQTRVLSSNGLLLVTFTPLSGETELVQHFQRDIKGVFLKGATWADAPHLDEEKKEELRQRYRVHERKARTQGIPMLGEGAIFPIDEDTLKVPPVDIPDHWSRIKGCDFGISHPAAGVEIAWDRDQDVLYVIDCYRMEGQTAPYHAAWFNKSNKWVPVAWPHDGLNREKAGGKQLHMAYRELGVNMMKDSARYPKAHGEKDEKGGAQPVWPIINEMLERMQTGRFKVFSTLPKWFEEFRSYHTKDGKIVDRRDDILKATMYAVMMKRKAVSKSQLAVHKPLRMAPIASSRI